MKKSFRQLFAGMVILSLAGTGWTSCSNEVDTDSPVRDGEVDVVMSTSLPQEIQTYAENSALGGLTNLENDGTYKVRYIMEIYPKGSTTRVERQIQYLDLNSSVDYRNTSFSTRLLAAEYDFVFWADIVEDATRTPLTDIEGFELPIRTNAYFFSKPSAEDEKNPPLYRLTSDRKVVEADLKTICATNCFDQTLQWASEMYDGYSCSKAVDLRTVITPQKFELKRPFAKLRLVTTDASEIEQAIDWSKTTVTLTGSNSIPYQFNALSGEVITSSDNSNAYWFLDQWCGNYENETLEDNEKALGVFYFPVNKISDNLGFSISVRSSDYSNLSKDIEITVENVPLNANKLTTIKGKLLTKPSEVSVTIKDPFDKDETIIEYGKEAATTEKLAQSLSGKSETVTYTGKITKAEGFSLNFDNLAESEPQTYAVENPLYKAGNDVELILKFTDIEEGAVLTFEGEVNAPKKLRIVTDTKCSLRIDLASSDVYYDGSNYKYIVTNSGCIGSKTGVQYDAIFGAGNGDRFYPASYTNAHNYKINADFTLPDDLKCMFVKKHEHQTCNFITTLQTWMNNNSGSTVWDFVGDTNN